VVRAVTSRNHRLCRASHAVLTRFLDACDVSVGHPLRKAVHVYAGAGAWRISNGKRYSKIRSAFYIAKGVIQISKSCASLKYIARPATRLAAPAALAVSDAPSSLYCPLHIQQFSLDPDPWPLGWTAPQQ